MIHLDDLMLRRTRLGLVLPEGGKGLLPDIRCLCKAILAWDDNTWEREETRYLELWRASYSLPATSPAKPGDNG